MQFKRLFSRYSVRCNRNLFRQLHHLSPADSFVKKKSIAPSTCFLLSRGKVLQFFIWLRLVKDVGSFQWMMFMLGSWDRNSSVFVLSGLLSCSVIAFDCCIPLFDTDYVRFNQINKKRTFCNCRINQLARYISLHLLSQIQKITY